MWAAADDMWDSEFILKLIPLVELENIVIAFSGWVGIDENNNQEIFSNKKYFNLDYSASSFLKHKRSLSTYIFQNWNTGKVNIIYGLIKKSVLVKSETIKKWGDFGFAGDHYMVIELLKYGNIKLCKEYLFYKRTHPGSSEAILFAQKVQKNLIYKTIIGVSNTIYLYYRYAVNIWKPLIYKNQSIFYSYFVFLFTIFEFVRINFILSKILTNASWRCFVNIFSFVFYDFAKYFSKER